ncbi:MAG: CoA transferase [Sulfobacillus acidophilus]|uniref:CoA transferase n=1 Tax=Sulfobacillus acidophilus TaxID=53633 RepID=A0A2T2WLV2_9FIRM|nr:MAG: CoA transferase [Sulfobacillus acidophilus]
MLENITVVDFSTLLPGPYATLRLADMGATVIKIEPPGGDPARSIGPVAQGTSLVFLAYNRKKTSVMLNLKDESDRNQALSMIRTADVVIEGFRPGVADRLGIGYDTANLINPRIVYCSLTGYGQTGSMTQQAGHDLNYLAVSGILSQLVDHHNQPIVPNLQLADLLGGIVAVEAILAALISRHHSGHGQHLDMAITDALIGLLGGHAAIQKHTGYPHGVAELAGTIICYNLYTTLDNRLVSLAALELKFWTTFCQAVNRPEWIAHQTSPAELSNPIYREMVTLFHKRPLSWWHRFSAQVDCCLQPVLEVHEALASPLATERDLVGVEQTSLGTFSYATTGAGGCQTRAYGSTST